MQHEMENIPKKQRGKNKTATPVSPHVRGNHGFGSSFGSPQLLFSGLGKGIPLKDPLECEKTPEMNELERDKNRVKI